MTQTEAGLKIPVTIVTGFLGAGKTTLLQRLVRESSGRRIAVIQNEVSEEMGIESAVLTSSDGAIIPDFFELPNGCICCSSKDDLIVTLENIVRLGRERIDYIIVETTGIADPCSVAEIFWLDNELCSFFTLDGIVAVVDCLNFESTILDDCNGKTGLGHSEIAKRQIAIADRILINKTDLSVAPDLERIVGFVRSLNPVAEIQTTKNSNVAVDWVLDIDSFDHSRLSYSLNHVPASVDHVYITFANSRFDRHHLDLVIGEMLWEADVGKIFRAKGLFKAASDDQWYGLQAVGALFETLPQPTAGLLPQNTGDAKFLFIGSQLDKEAISHKISDAIHI